MIPTTTLQDLLAQCGFVIDTNGLTTTAGEPALLQDVLDALAAAIAATDAEQTAQDALIAALEASVTALQAQVHDPASVDAGSNPALTLDAGTQVASLDLTTAGSYDNAASGLTADDIQGAIDELATVPTVGSFALGDDTVADRLADATAALAGQPDGSVVTYDDGVVRGAYELRGGVVVETLRVAEKRDYGGVLANNTQTAFDATTANGTIIKETAEVTLDVVCRTTMHVNGFYQVQNTLNVAPDTPNSVASFRLLAVLDGTATNISGFDSFQDGVNAGDPYSFAGTHELLLTPGTHTLKFQVEMRQNDLTGADGGSVNQFKGSYHYIDRGPYCG